MGVFLTTKSVDNSQFVDMFPVANKTVAGKRAIMETFRHTTTEGRMIARQHRESFVLSPELGKEIRQLAKDSDMSIQKCHERVVLAGIPIVRKVAAQMKASLDQYAAIDLSRPSQPKPKGGP